MDNKFNHMYNGNIDYLPNFDSISLYSHIEGIDINEVYEQAEKSIFFTNDQMFFYLNDLGDFHSINDICTVIYLDGEKRWYKYGLLHRVQKPAIIYNDGKEEYYLENELSNILGPAVIYPNGSKEYWLCNKKHRLDGPAVIDFIGNEEWWFDGLIHNKNGPAIKIYSKEKFLYYLEGEHFSMPDGNFEYQTRSGNKYKYYNKKLHSKNGPAIQYYNGDYEYWDNGHLHNLNGLALCYKDGSEEIWQNGVCLQKQDMFGNIKYNNIVGDTEKHIFIDGVAYYKNNQYHAEKHPALENELGKFWYVNGKLHREDGPAVIYKNGNKEYWLHGKQYDSEKYELNRHLNNKYKSKGKSKIKKI